ncbi:hypothetical protein DMC30DRAFT_399995 [Rhodotorula diobovata]|uniref:Ricin B lectin domain-containing protein n=1 Tax=Rhodotorula diobovata TaxID=5288 RepID=A0A5C5FRR4_9BASI|nr:hypothetical protein DMC30DRAFT_399995 [Rhodotorula diobovata]
MMRVLLTALSLALSVGSTFAAPNGVGGLAGTIDNSAQAASLQSAAVPPAAGSYIFRNVATGQALSYTADGNHIVPSDGAGTPVQVLGYGAAVPWVRLQIGDKDKCLSSQWGGSYNLAGVMYSCAVDVGGEITRADNTLESTKQWWLMVPVADYAGDSSSSTHVLLAAQAHSVATREKAQAGFARVRRRALSSPSSLHASSPARFARVKRGATDAAAASAPAPDARQPWRVLAAEFQAAEARRIAEEERVLRETAAREAARAASSKSAADKATVASGAASHTVALAASAAAPTTAEEPAAGAASPTPSAVESAADPVSLVKVDDAASASDAVEEEPTAETAYEPDADVKLNVVAEAPASSSASGSGAFFIIPVDHLIDSAPPPSLSLCALRPRAFPN